MKFDFILRDFSVWKNKPNKFSIIFSSKWDMKFYHKRKSWDYISDMHLVNI